MDSQFLFKLFSDAYVRLQHQPAFPWPSSDLFIQEWTDCFQATQSSPLSYRVLTKLLEWDEAGRVQVFRVLEALTPPGIYPAFIDNDVRKLKREVLDKSLEDSLTSLTLSGSGCGGSERPRLNNSLGNTLLSPEFTDYEAAQQSLPFDTTEDPSIISNTGEEPQVTEISGFADTSLIDSSVPPPLSVPLSQDYVKSIILESLIRTNKRSKSRSSAAIEHPKKEYFRCQHIRALKKSLRQIKTGKLPGASIHKVTRNSHMRKWEEMKVFYNTHRAELDRLAATISGPLVDARSLRDEMSMDVDTAKTYSDSFVLMFFSPETMRAYNQLFSDLVYDGPPAEICEKMKKTRCCKGPHSEHCEEVWREVCAYAKEGMWRELEEKRSGRTS